jgi:hypothetical protein
MLNPVSRLFNKLNYRIPQFLHSPEPISPILILNGSLINKTAVNILFHN